jgi:chromosome segregation ATPase
VSEEHAASKHTTRAANLSYLQERNSELETKLKGYAELFQQFEGFLSDAVAAHEKAEARAVALEGELGESRRVADSLREKLTAVEARHEEARGETDRLKKELDEARTQLAQFQKEASAGAHEAQGRMSELLHEQTELQIEKTELLRSLAETREQLRAEEAALNEEKSKNAALRQEHERTRRRLLLLIAAALTGGLSVGWVFTHVLSR